MFGWLGGSKLRAENSRLRGELETLKAASISPPATPELVAGGGNIGPLANQPNLGAIREQLAHFKDWQYVAISAICRKIAAAELCVGYTPTSPAGLRTKAATIQPEVLPAHPLIDAIDDPNEAMTRWQLLYVLTAQLCLTGRAYLWFRDDGASIKAYPLPPDWVSRDPDTTPFDPVWIVRPRGNPTEFRIPGEDIAYFSLPDPMDPTGAISPLAAQASAVNLSESISTAHVATMVNSCKPGMVLTVGRHAAPGAGGVPAASMPRYELTPEQRNQLIGTVNKAFQSMLKYGNTIILDALIESVVPFSNSATDVDFQGGAALAKARIFQAYGIHEFIVGQSVPGSYAQMAVAERVFLDTAINPLLKLIGEVLSGWLGYKFAGPNGAKLKVWFRPLIARDDELDLKRMQIAASKPNVVRVNELRAFANLPPLTDDEGGDDFVGSKAAESSAIDPAAVKMMIEAADPYTAPRINGHSHRLKNLLGHVARS
jgi:phage portal protein BeeE